jgi:hypothetical protein
MSLAAFGQVKAGSKWVTLLNCKSLKGWNSLGKANWHLENGYRRTRETDSW